MPVCAHNGEQPSQKPRLLKGPAYGPQGGKERAQSPYNWERAQESGQGEQMSSAGQGIWVLQDRQPGLPSPPEIPLKPAPQSLPDLPCSSF